MNEQAPEMYDMDFRDYVAVAAMQALIQVGNRDPEGISADAYLMADAMIKHRKVSE